MDSVKELEAHIKTLKDAIKETKDAYILSDLSQLLQDAIQLHWQMTRPKSQPWYGAMTFNSTEASL